MAKTSYWKRNKYQLTIGLLYLFFIPRFVSAQAILSAEFKDTPLPIALKSLESQGHLQISYDPSLVNGLKVTASFSEKKTQEAFDLLLARTALMAEILPEGYVVIKKKIVEIPVPDIKISGSVIDAETGEALPFVTIYSKQSRRTALTDEAGRFTLMLPASSAEKDSLGFQYLGYHSFSYPTAQLINAKNAPLKMQVNSRQLLEIVITDHAVDPVGLPVIDQNNTGKRPERGGFVPGLGEPDPMRMLQFLPGISAEGDKAGELLVRGGGSDQNLLLWEGIPIYHTGHLFGVVSALNPYVVKEVNIWKGDFSADKGGRASSVIEMNSGFNQIDKFKVAVGVNLLSVYGALEIPLAHKKAGLLLAGRIANSDLIKNAFYQRLFGYATQNSRIRNDQDIQNSDTALLHSIRIQPTSGFSDFNGKFFWHPNEKTFFDFNAYTGSDELKYRVDANVKDWDFYYAGGDTVAVANVGFSAKLQRKWTPDYKTEWSWAWSAYISDYKFSSSFDSLVYPQQQQRQNNSIVESVFKFDNQWRLSTKQVLRFGFQSVKTGNVFSEIFTDHVTPDRGWEWKSDVPSNQSAFYGIWQAGDQQHWHFETGLRRVIFNYATRTYWEPRIAAHWFPAKGLQFKFNAGVFRQFMRQAYIWNDLGLNNEAWFTADDKSQLPVLTNRQMTYGIGYQRTGWVLDLEMYTKWLNPVTGVNLRFNGQPQSVWDIRGDETAVGVEGLLRKRWGIYTQLLSYTYGRSSVRYDSLNAGQTFPGDYDQRHSLSWAHHFGWKHWVLSASWNYRSGRPFTPPKGINVVDNPDGSTERSVQYGRWNSARLPDYQRMDLSVQYVWKRRVDGAAGISFYNFLNHPNIQSREFFVDTVYHDDGSQGYGVSSIERSLLPRTANLFVLFKW